MLFRHGLLSCLALLGCTLSSLGGSARIDPNGTLVASFRGWGTSLCWWANIVGGLKNHEEFANSLFTDLRLTIVRYNIGGGENPAYPGLPSSPRARMQGFQPERGKWNLDADANQRLMLRDAVKRGIKHIDAFSNSPPWWMTASGSVTGGVNPFGDNLKPASEKEFADYLVEVMSQLARRDGIRFDTIAPMNEPLSPWWVGNRQEGCHMGIAQQARVLDHLHAALETAGMTIGLVAPETFSTDEAIRALKEFPDATRRRLCAVATHGYDTRKSEELHKAAGETPVWMSEHGDRDSSGLQTARAILDDLNLLHAQEWIYWQAVEPDNGWGLITNPLDGSSTQCERTPRYDVLRQFANFIPPGSRIVTTHHADSIAAMPPGGESLIVIALNSRTAEERFSADVSAATSENRTARVIQTTATDRFREKTALTVKNGSLESVLPPGSLTTFIIPLR